MFSYYLSKMYLHILATFTVVFNVSPFVDLCKNTFWSHVPPSLLTNIKLCYTIDLNSIFTQAYVCVRLVWSVIDIIVGPLRTLGSRWPLGENNLFNRTSGASLWLLANKILKFRSYIHTRYTDIFSYKVCSDICCSVRSGWERRRDSDALQ